MKKLLLVLTICSICWKSNGQSMQFMPPWNTPPESIVNFTVQGIDNIPDLYGDVNDPQLVVFFAGNQFMCVDSLLAAFKSKYPKYQRIFVETLPPGILAKQIKGGSITIGNMRLSVKPDIYTAGRGRMKEMMSFMEDTVTYAHNQLSIMVQKGNPKNIHSLKDLGRKDVRVSMPNPAWEGIGGQIVKAYKKAGGASLERKVMTEKVKAGTTILTRIHHRQTPLNVLHNICDAGPVWYSESTYQKLIGNPVELIKIPEEENITAYYVAGKLKEAPHKKAAADFLKFLSSDEAKAIYKYYGFNRN